jgi:alpha-glucosidase
MSSPDPWWSQAVFYQIYPRSFADGNGDGTGDLIGARARLPYLRELGIDAVWLSPFYRSPMADGGYDISDPRDVDPIFGTLADFDAFLADAHEHGLKVTIDLVPNHVSVEHPWFRAALAAAPGSAERDRFIFREGGGPDGAEPPNNWPSAFGGPAWTRLPDGWWYLHLFDTSQPDLDWTNPEVRAEYERTVRFWLDRGVDGFRVDVAPSMAKEPGLPDMPPETLAEIAKGGANRPADDLRWDREGVHEYHRALRRILDSYDGDVMAVAEAYVSDPSRLARYVRPDEFQLAFNFELLEAEWNASTLRAAIDRSMDELGKVGATCTWVLANHDQDRVATRWGSLARARAGALLQFALPGAAYIYNGDELGLPNAELPDDALQDPTWERSGHTDRGRDGERVPLPWSGRARPYGFTTGATTWLPMPDDWAPYAVTAQSDDPASTLTLYRRALQARRDFAAAPFAWTDAPGPGCLAFRRGDLLVVVNAGDTPVVLPAGEVVLASGPLSGALLPTDTTAWIAAP